MTWHHVVLVDTPSDPAWARRHLKIGRKTAALSEGNLAMLFVTQTMPGRAESWRCSATGSSSR